MNADTNNVLFLDLSTLRHEYMQRSLDEVDASDNPITQFTTWLNQAIEAQANEPNAMTLATCGFEGAPSARIVLLKRVDHRGFTFFTNYLSRKGKDLAENPRAALVFFWPELERQVRVEGQIVKTDEQESEDYFNSRPPDSRVGSALSQQSVPIESRAVLEKLKADLLAKFPQGNVPRPKHWGGYRVIPSRIEFWQGRQSRLHDRIEYVLDKQGKWSKRRLAP